MNPHGIVAAKGLAAVGTFPCPVGKSVLDALVAEDMATCLDYGIFKSALTDLAL